MLRVRDFTFANMSQASSYMFANMHVPLAWCRNTAKPRGNEVRVKVKKPAKATKKSLAPLQADAKMPLLSLLLKSVRLVKP